MKRSPYDYNLPSHLIAEEPLSPRDHSKLLIYRKDDRAIIHDRFFNIKKYLPDRLSVIFNSTKVIKARVYGRKVSGGKVELLYERENIFQIRGRVREGSCINLNGGYSAEVVELMDDGFRRVEIFKDSVRLDRESYLEMFEDIGHVPLPPYIDRRDSLKDELNYQSVFASREGSVAAPTASLHFTQELFLDFKESFRCGFVTLHVGSGTFKPLSSSDIYKHKMHGEIFLVPESTREIVDSNDKLLCVGSTALRTIEEYARSHRCGGETNIYINPKNPPQRVEYLLTNFHLPNTSLLVMVASIIGEDELSRVYKEAIDMEYRFFSYGDAMLIV